MKTILIIDDNNDILDLLEVLISNRYTDYSILKSNDSIDAINLLKEDFFSNRRISLIICDFEMPGGNGNEVHQANEVFKLPFIFHSSSLDTHQYEISYTNEFHTYNVEKPAQPELMFQTIDKALSSLHTDPEQFFYPISPIFTLRSLTIPIDIYIKISAYHYTLVSNKNIPNISLIKKYIQNESFSYFYIKGEDFKLLTNKLCSSKSNIEDFSLQVELIQIYSKNFITDEKDIIFLKSKCTELFNLLKSDAKSASLFIKVFHQGSFVITHSLLTYFLSFSLLKKYNLHTESNLTSFFYASIFHDINSTEKMSKDFRKISNDSIKRTVQVVEKIAPINDSCLPLLEKININTDRFKTFDLLAKILISSHALATLACAQKVFNYNLLIDKYLKDEAIAIYEFLKH